MNRMRLGELLLQQHACTREQLAEAWEQKVLFGDRLGTNLLLIGALDEETLVRALGAQHNLPWATAAQLRVDPSAVALVPKAIAERRQVVPHHVEGRTLHLLMADPSDAIAIDEVRFATGGLRIAPVVICEARLWQLLVAVYGSRGSLRPNPLDQPPVRRSLSIETPTVVGATPAELNPAAEFAAL